MQNVQDKLLYGGAEYYHIGKLYYKHYRKLKHLHIAQNVQMYFQDIEENAKRDIKFYFSGKLTQCDAAYILFAS